MNADTRRKVVLMFSGLGSETFQMGRELFAKNQVFRTSLLELESIARCYGAYPMLNSERLQHDQLTGLADTCLTIYMLQLAMVRTLKTYGIEPDCMLAVSMGFFAAATVAGCMEPEEAMRAITVQAKTIEMCCPPGGMLAVLAPLELSRDPNVARFCEIAAINNPSHFVVAADSKGLLRVEGYLRQRGVTCQRLPVDYAFHSRWIDEARVPLEKLLVDMAGRPSRIPLICCARADRMQYLSPEYFWQIARSPIRFYETIQYLDKGTSLYIDVGPAGSLAATLKGALGPNSSSLVMPTITPFHNDLQNLEALLAFKQNSQADSAPNAWTNRITV
ncbi:MAG TPA: acyltransferase domain-containing protein [Candidatus Angelobacter sp.]